VKSYAVHLMVVRFWFPMLNGESAVKISTVRPNGIHRASASRIARSVVVKNLELLWRCTTFHRGILLLFQYPGTMSKRVHKHSIFRYDVTTLPKIL
jgi:hypothetical protein